MPRAVITSGRGRVMFRPSNVIRPKVGRIRPVSMLKKVVLPAPFGPISETIDWAGMSNVTSLTAVRPPNRLVIRSARRIGVRRRGPGCLLARGAGARPRRARAHAVPSGSLPSCASSAGISAVSSSRRRRSGSSPCGRSTMVITSRNPKIPNSTWVSWKFRPNGRRQVVEHVGDQVVVDVAEQQAAGDRAPDRAEPADDHHGEDEDREPELELARVHLGGVGRRRTPRTSRRRPRRSRTRAAWSSPAGCPSRPPRPRPRAAPPRPGRAASRAPAG